MAEIILSRKGRILYRLTCNHAASSHGIPVLVDEQTKKAYSYWEMRSMENQRQLLHDVSASCEDIEQARQLWAHFEPPNTDRPLLRH